MVLVHSEERIRLRDTGSLFSKASQALQRDWSGLSQVGQQPSGFYVLNFKEGFMNIF